MNPTQHSVISTETPAIFDACSDAFLTQDLLSGFVCPLTDLGLLAFGGEDAASFLHRQLTNDVEHLRQDEARLAGYCTAQGRLLATCLMWRSHGGIALQMPREILPGLQKRLKMFVLRDKVTVADIGNDYLLLGLGGNGADDALSRWFPALPVEPYALVNGEYGALIRLADAFGAKRYQWIAPADAVAALWPALTTALMPVDARAWRLADIDAGVPQIGAATQEKFVAQMINFELVGGVNFRKGCYPGQEIVARTQYLGKSRRRMLAARTECPDGILPSALPGMDIFCSVDPSQPCGSVVNAERGDGRTLFCLVSLRLPVPAGATVRLGSADGPVLNFVALPYALPDDSVAA